MSVFSGLSGAALLTLGLATGAWASEAQSPAGPGSAEPAANPPPGLMQQWQERVRPVIAPPAPPAPAPSLAPTAQAEPTLWSLLMEDLTLYQTLSRWSAQAEWQLVWEAERDFPIEANVHLPGSFLSAVGTVMESLRGSDYPLQAVVNLRARTLRVVRHLEYAPR